MTNAGGCEEPAATAERPPKRSAATRSPPQISASTPASRAAAAAISARRVGGFSAGGVLARSRARLIDSPTTWPRRRARSSQGASPGPAIVSAPKGWRQGDDLRRSGPRVPTIRPSTSDAATAEDSPPAGRATATASRGLLASRLARATPAAYIGPGARATRSPRPKTYRPRAARPAAPWIGVTSPTARPSSPSAISRDSSSPAGVPSRPAGIAASSRARPTARVSATISGSGRSVDWRRIGRARLGGCRRVD